jgi:nucleotide-binding universal stress UspA family protein
MLERILLAIDESEHARKAVPAAVELARAGGGTVHVLHVRELAYARATVVGDSPEEAQQLVDGVVEELKQAGVVAEGSVRTSTTGPARVILEHARDVEATMIVLGSRGLGALAGLLLGSVAHKIIQLASCPVLVVRDEGSLDKRDHDVLRAQTRFQA